MLNWLGSLAHSAAVGSARLYFNYTYTKVGRMTELKIDNKTKRIEATFDLKGETQPIHLTVDGYNLDTSTAQPTITLHSITVSREWMAAIAAEMLKNKPIPLPAAAARALNLVL